MYKRQGHDAAGETDHHNSGGEPDGRDDELAPDLLVDAYRKGHHYVALVLQKIFVKPADHQHKRDDSHGEDPHDEQHDEDGTQRAQEGTVRIQHTPAGEIGTHRHQQQDAEQGLPLLAVSATASATVWEALIAWSRKKFTSASGLPLGN